MPCQEPKKKFGMSALMSGNTEDTKQLYPERQKTLAGMDQELHVSFAFNHVCTKFPLSGLQFDTVPKEVPSKSNWLGVGTSLNTAWSLQLFQLAAKYFAFCEQNAGVSQSKKLSGRKRQRRASLDEKANTSKSKTAKAADQNSQAVVNPGWWNLEVYGASRIHANGVYKYDTRAGQHQETPRFVKEDVHGTFVIEQLPVPPRGAGDGRSASVKWVLSQYENHGIFHRFGLFEVLLALQEGSAVGAQVPPIPPTCGWRPVIAVATPASLQDFVPSVFPAPNIRVVLADPAKEGQVGARPADLELLHDTNVLCLADHCDEIQSSASSSELVSLGRRWEQQKKWAVASVLEQSIARPMNQPLVQQKGGDSPKGVEMELAADLESTAKKCARQWQELGSEKCAVRRKEDWKALFKRPQNGPAPLVRAVLEGQRERQWRRRTLQEAAELCQIRISHREKDAQKAQKTALNNGKKIFQEALLVNAATLFKKSMPSKIDAARVLAKRGGKNRKSHETGEPDTTVAVKEEHDDDDFEDEGPVAESAAYLAELARSAEMESVHYEQNAPVFKSEDQEQQALLQDHISSVPEHLGVKQEAHHSHTVRPPKSLATSVLSHIEKLKVGAIRPNLLFDRALLAERDLHDYLQPDENQPENATAAQLVDETKSMDAEVYKIRLKLEEEHSKLLQSHSTKKCEFVTQYTEILVSLLLGGDLARAKMSKEFVLSAFKSSTSMYGGRHVFTIADDNAVQHNYSVVKFDRSWAYEHDMAQMFFDSTYRQSKKADLFQLTPVVSNPFESRFGSPEKWNWLHHAGGGGNGRGSNEQTSVKTESRPKMEDTMTSPIASRTGNGTGETPDRERSGAKMMNGHSPHVDVSKAQIEHEQQRAVERNAVPTCAVNFARRIEEAFVKHPSRQYATMVLDEKRRFVGDYGMSMVRHLLQLWRICASGMILRTTDAERLLVTNGVAGEEDDARVPVSFSRHLACMLMLQLAFRKGRWGPFLVVAPPELLETWEGDLEQICAPWLRVLPYWGSKPDRVKMREFLSISSHTYLARAAVHIVLVPPHVLQSDIKFLQRFYWQLLVLDDWLEEDSNSYHIPPEEIQSACHEADDEDFNEEPPTFKGDASVWPNVEGKFDSWKYVRTHLNARLRVVVTSDFFCRKRKPDQDQQLGMPDMIHALKWMVPSFFPMKHAQLNAAWTAAPFTTLQVDRIENALYVMITGIGTIKMNDGDAAEAVVANGGNVEAAVEQEGDSETVAANPSLPLALSDGTLKGTSSRMQWPALVIEGSALVNVKDDAVFDFEVDQFWRLRRMKRWEHIKASYFKVPEIVESSTGSGMVLEQENHTYLQSRQTQAGGDGGVGSSRCGVNVGTLPMKYSRFSTAPLCFTPGERASHFYPGGASPLLGGSGTAVEDDDMPSMTVSKSLLSDVYLAGEERDVEPEASAAKPVNADTTTQDHVAEPWAPSEGGTGCWKKYSQYSKVQLFADADSSGSEARTSAVGIPKKLVETKAIRYLCKRMTPENTLHLVTNADMFEAISTGKIKCDFREMKDYWSKRIQGKKHSYFHFRLGYSKDGPSVIVEANGSERIKLSDPRAQNVGGALRNAKALEGRHLPSAASTEVYMLNIGRTVFNGQYNDLKHFIDVQKAAKAQAEAQDATGESTPSGSRPSSFSSAAAAAGSAASGKNRYRLFDTSGQQAWFCDGSLREEVHHLLDYLPTKTDREYVAPSATPQKDMATGEGTGPVEWEVSFVLTAMLKALEGVDHEHGSKNAGMALYKKEWGHVIGDFELGGGAVEMSDQKRNVYQRLLLGKRWDEATSVATDDVNILAVDGRNEHSNSIAYTVCDVLKYLVEQVVESDPFDTDAGWNMSQHCRVNEAGVASLYRQLSNPDKIPRQEGRMVVYCERFCVLSGPNQTPAMWKIEVQLGNMVHRNDDVLSVGSASSSPVRQGIPRVLTVKNRCTFTNEAIDAKAFMTARGTSDPVWMWHASDGSRVAWRTGGMAAPKLQSALGLKRKRSSSTNTKGAEGSQSTSEEEPSRKKAHTTTATGVAQMTAMDGIFQNDFVDRGYARLEGPGISYTLRKTHAVIGRCSREWEGFWQLQQQSEHAAVVDNGGSCQKRGLNVREGTEGVDVHLPFSSHPIPISGFRKSRGPIVLQKHALLSWSFKQEVWTIMPVHPTALVVVDGKPVEWNGVPAVLKNGAAVQIGGAFGKLMTSGSAAAAGPAPTATEVARLQEVAAFHFLLPSTAHKDTLSIPLALAESGELSQTDPIRRAAFAHAKGKILPEEETPSSQNVRSSGYFQPRTPNIAPISNTSNVHDDNSEVAQNETPPLLEPSSANAMSVESSVMASSPAYMNAIAAASLPMSTWNNAYMNPLLTSENILMQMQQFTPPSTVGTGSTAAAATAAVAAAPAASNLPPNIASTMLQMQQFPYGFGLGNSLGNNLGSSLGSSSVNIANLSSLLGQASYLPVGFFVVWVLWYFTIHCHLTCAFVMHSLF
jgi:hypothetical protein